MQQENANQSESWRQRLPPRVYDVCINLSENILPQHLNQERFKCLLLSVESFQDTSSGAISQIDGVSFISRLINVQILLTAKRTAVFYSYITLKGEM